MRLRRQRALGIVQTLQIGLCFQVLIGMDDASLPPYWSYGLDGLAGYYEGSAESDGGEFVAGDEFVGVASGYAEQFGCLGDGKGEGEGEFCRW